jgi:protein-tyrosine-phosphatase
MVGRHTRVLDRRYLIGLTLAGLAAPRLAWAAGCAPPRVLFVCPVGTVKSAIAREMLKTRAATRGVAVRASSRGLQVENHVSPALSARLIADRIDPASEPAQALTPDDVAAADIVVAFDEAADAPSLRGARNWPTPSWNNDYDAAKAATTAHIDALVDELAARGCAAAAAAG